MSSPDGSLAVRRVLMGLTITVPPELRETVLRLMTETVQITVSTSTSGDMEILVSEYIIEDRLPN